MISLNPAQGIEGKVYRLQGNQMSSFGSTEPEPVETAVWIFAGQIPGHDPRWSVSEACQHPQWIASLISNETGDFLIGLPPGEFTLFAQYDADLYLNAFAGPTSYQTVQVQAGQLTRFDLINTEMMIY